MFRLSFKLLMQNKKRAISTLVAIILSTALIIAVGIYQDYSSAQLKGDMYKRIGKRDIVLFNEHGFSQGEINWIKNLKDVVFSSSSITYKGTIRDSKQDKKQVNISAVDIVEYNKIKKMDLLKGSFFSKDLDEKEILLGGNALKKLEKDINDEIEVNINGTYVKYRITGILDDSFMDTGLDEISVFVPLKTFRKEMNLEDYINTISLDIGQVEENITEVEKQINSRFREEIIVNNLYNQYKSIKRDIDSAIVAFNSLTYIVVFATCGILLNIYSVIIYERLRIMGILRTIGLKKRDLKKLYITEGIVLGIIGSIIGIIFGVILGNLFNIIDNKYFAWEMIRLPEITNSIFAIIVGVIMPLVAIMLQIKKVGKLDSIEMLMEIKLKDSYYKKDNDNRNFVIGVVLIAIYPLLRYLEDKYINNNYIASILPAILIFLAVLGMELIMPNILKYFSLTGDKLSYRLFSGTAIIASRNLSRNVKRTKSTIITIVVSLMLTIGCNGISDTFRKTVVKYIDKNLKYDIEVDGFKNITTKETNKKIQDLSRVDGISSIQEVAIKRFKDKKSGISIYLYSMAPEGYDEMLNLEILDEKKYTAGEVLNRAVNSTIISERVATDLGLKLGDDYIVNFENKQFNLKVVGITNTYEYNANVIFTGRKLFKDYKDLAINRVLIKTKEKTDNIKLVDSIKEILGNGEYNVLTIKEIKEQWKKNAVKNTQSLDFLIAIVSFVSMAMFINTLVLSVIERKQEFGLLRSIGARKKTVRNIIVMESLFIGSIGIIAGVILGMIFTTEGSRLMSSVVNVRVEVYQPVIGIILVSFIALLCILAASLYPAYIGIKPDIIETARYE